MICTLNVVITSYNKWSNTSFRFLWRRIQASWFVGKCIDVLCHKPTTAGSLNFSSDDGMPTQNMGVFLRLVVYLILRNVKSVRKGFIVGIFLIVITDVCWMVCLIYDVHLRNTHPTTLCIYLNFLLRYLWLTFLVDNLCNILSKRLDHGHSLFSKCLQFLSALFSEEGKLQGRQLDLSNTTITQLVDSCSGGSESPATIFFYILWQQNLLLNNCILKLFGKF